MPNLRSQTVKKSVLSFRVYRAITLIKCSNTRSPISSMSSCFMCIAHSAIISVIVFMAPVHAAKHQKL